MKIDDRRGVIEMLLCAGDPDETLGIGDICLLDDALHLFEFAVIQRQGACRDVHRDNRYGALDCYEDDCLEAAYRLIESSPTLRREWFGVR